MIFRGASPRRPPLHALSRAASLARSVRLIALAMLVHPRGAGNDLKTEHRT